MGRVDSGSGSRQAPEDVTGIQPPDGGMLGRGGGEPLQKAFAIRVMDEVVRQQTRRLIRIGGTAPPGREVAHGGGYGSISTGEYPAAAPVDDIDMGVDLKQSRCRMGLCTGSECR